jgi:hypothetical protein
MGVNALACCLVGDDEAPVICVGGDDESTTVVRLKALEDQAEASAGSGAHVKVKNVSWIPAVGGAAVRDIWCDADAVVAASVDERIHVWSWMPVEAELPFRPPPTGLEASLDHAGVELSDSSALGRSALADCDAAARLAGLRLQGRLRHNVCDVGGLAVVPDKSGVLRAVLNGHGLETVRITGHT